MFLSLPEHYPTTFQTDAQFWASIDLQSPHLKLLQYGVSRDGRPLRAVVAGSGPQTAVLMAGAHADEPVGPETLRLLIQQLDQHEPKALFEQWTLLILPHINPDGEAANQGWIQTWPDLADFLNHRQREQPGEDLEFGYPDMRPENQAVTEFLKPYAPFDLQVNLHGMAFSEGALLLIESDWIERENIQPLKVAFANWAKNAGLNLHDHDRHREKGFIYGGPGFTTTPQGRAMQQYFLDHGDEVTASKFHLSSMEWIRDQGGDPLCLVSELPLWVVSSEQFESEPGTPTVYLKWNEKLEELKEVVPNRELKSSDYEAFDLEPLSVEMAIQIQGKLISKSMDLLS
ncbi:MAG: M14 family zinc carboxypeptidase [Bacteroidota bacterium]